MDVSSSKLYTHLIKRTNSGTSLAFPVLVPRLLLIFHDLPRGPSLMAPSFYAVVSPFSLGFGQVVPHTIDFLGSISDRA